MSHADAPPSTAFGTQTRRCEFPRSGADVNTIAGSMELMGTRITYARNGSFTMVAVRSSASKMAGEVFGLESNEEHHLSAEAVNDTVLLVVKRTALVARDADIARQLWSSVFKTTCSFWAA